MTGTIFLGLPPLPLLLLQSTQLSPGGKAAAMRCREVGCTPLVPPLMSGLVVSAQRPPRAGICLPICHRGIRLWRLSGLYKV